MLPSILKSYKFLRNVLDFKFAFSKFAMLTTHTARVERDQRIEIWLRKLKCEWYDGERKILFSRLH